MKLFHVLLHDFSYSLQERVGRRCAGLRLLNSYWVGQDSTFKFYECIMVDTHHKVLINFFFCGQLANCPVSLLA